MLDYHPSLLVLKFNKTSKIDNFQSQLTVVLYEDAFSMTIYGKIELNIKKTKK